MSKKIVIIAGEESGDQHAAKLVSELQQIYPDLEISGLGGYHLQALGMHNVMDLTKLAITGLTGVLTHLKSIHQAFKLIKKHLINNPPDLVILVDYPGFNLRMAKWIKTHLSCPVLYYISPQIWAWKEKRKETIRQYVDHMAVILPFEYELYRNEQIPVSYVGHPLIESLQVVPAQSQCRAHFNWDNQQKILAVCPGSRMGEIKRHMPVFMDALKGMSAQDLKVVIPVAKSLCPSVLESYLKDCPFPYELVSGQAQLVMNAADAVIVASGTASLESALLNKPTCIIYKSSWLNYYLARLFMKVNYLGLSNLLQGQMVIPELLQDDCNPQELSKMIELLLHSEVWRSNMVRRLQKLNHSLIPQQHNTLPNLVIELMGIK